MRRLTKRACILLTSMAWLVPTTAVFAGPIATPSATPTATATGTPTATGTATATATATPTATATATASPTATGTPTATATATPPPTCQNIWPSICIFTTGKGKKASNNAKVTHLICGHIPNPGQLAQNATRIPICRGTSPEATITDSTGPGGLGVNNTASSTNMVCGPSGGLDANVCSVNNLQGREKYIARSADGKDTDRITFLLPK